MSKRPICALFAVTALVFASTTFALELERAFDDVVKDAERVVHGEITHVESAWITRDGARHIVTRATFEVKDWYKGSGGPALTLEFPGGTVGSITEWVSDAVRPRVGAELVLALDAADGDRVPPATSRVFPVTNGQVGGLGGGMTIARFAGRVRAVLNHETPPLAGPRAKAVAIETQARAAAPAARPTAARESNLETLISESFEGDFPPPGWTVTGETPQWGPTTYTAASGTHSAWCAGTPTGSSPADGVPIMNPTRLVYGPFDLSHAGNAWADYKYRWGQVSLGQSFRPLISIDGVNFYPDWYTFYAEEWTPERIDFQSTVQWGNICGEPRVWLAFEFQDWLGRRAGPGAFVDDVTIVLDTTPRADLLPTEFAQSATTVVQGDPFDVDVRIENRGLVASGPVKVEFRLVFDIPSGASLWLGEAEAPHLEPGESAWVPYHFTMPNTGYGTYRFRVTAMADSRYEVVEYGERNNRAAAPQNVTGRDLGYAMLTSIEPARGPAGTGDPVHFLGVGFGNSYGQGDGPWFHVGNGYDNVHGDVLSWSDGDVVATVPTAILNDYPVSAGTGPVWMSSNGRLTSPLPYHVTFGYGGVRWNGWRVPFHFGQMPVAIPAAEAVRSAASTWNSTGGAFRIEAQTSSQAYSAPNHDGTNVIGFASLPNGVLGATYCWLSGSALAECDIALNTLYPWTAGSDTPVDGKFDVETIALHELGHWLNLRDLYGGGWGSDTAGDSPKVMYGYGDYSFKRALTEGDAAGLTWIYGRLATLHLAASGASPAIAVTPADLDASTGSTLPCDLDYREGTAVTLTAPATSGTTMFDRWELTGSEPVRSTSASLVLGPGASAATAFYVPILERCDADGSGRVDGLDLILLSSAFGRSEGEPGYVSAADFDRNGIVDGNDLALLASSFGRSVR